MNPVAAHLMRTGAACLLAVSGVIHAQLYLQGYRTIPGVGPAFLLQASAAPAVAVLLLFTSAAVLRLAAAALAAGALAGFVLSRTVGVFGFVEHGPQPAPYALISVLAEIAVLALLGAPLLSRTSRPAPSLSR
ncbi:hypothetical protein [Pseudonocardia acidicola]|uniref:DUF4345 domain-containing protein n=1 Tax=Pseudonocardia acidicola TaxID=2724939 RepID=A0ABX1SEN8_9PSEU|nr:hypothetical protein [Pseudonocardia acidicola]NMH99374.1 hypothetical protein [Pseudonocardia acidicola]